MLVRSGKEIVAESAHAKKPFDKTGQMVLQIAAEALAGKLIKGIDDFFTVANSNSNNVSAYTMADTTGVLTPMPGSPLAPGTSPSSLSIDPAGRFAYVANVFTISGFTIDATSGALTAMAGSPFPAGITPASITDTGTIQ